MAISAAIVGGLGAAGSIAGGILSKPDKVDPKTSWYYPPSDPVLSGASLEAMIGLGLNPTLILEQASPINQLINRINMNPTLTDKQKAQRIRALGNAQSVIQNNYFEGSTHPIVGNEEFQAGMSNLLHKRGIKSAMLEAGLAPEDIGNLLQQEYQYRQYTQDILSQVQEGQGDIFAGRLSTQQAIGSLMGEIGDEYGGGQSPTVRAFMTRYEADINQTYDKQLEDVMRMANVTGFNPGRAIADLEDSRASALRNMQSTGVLEAGKIVSLMQGTLQPGQQYAGQIGNIRTGQGIGAAGVAGNQASAINEIQASINSQRAQAVGAGVAGAGQSISDAFLMAGIMNSNPGIG